MKFSIEASIEVVKLIVGKKYQFDIRNKTWSRAVHGVVEQPRIDAENKIFNSWRNSWS